MLKQKTPTVPFTFLTTKSPPKAQRSKILAREQQTPKSSSDSDSEDIFEPQYHTMKKLHLPIARKIKRGAWSHEENKIYLDFMKKNIESFRSEAQRRMERVFCQLSETLNRMRTPDQCRTHHQKLLSRLQTVQALVEHLQQKIQDYQQYPCRRKTRLIGKFCFRKAYQKEVLKVEELPFGRVKTFKNSSHVMVEIRDADIQSYNFQ